jgi:cation transport ATPase
VRSSVVWQNIIFGVIYILVLMTLAIWGPLKPITAAVAHTVSTAVVIFNSARLVRFGEERVEDVSGYTGSVVVTPTATAS